MTGTLPSIPLQQNIDENGLPQSGARLFLYEANTSTPVISYKDYLMTPGAEHSWPITADAMGRVPMFFLPDGFYRARLEERDGAPIYDEPQLPALSTGEGVGDPVPPASVLQWSVGDFLWQPTIAARVGWVRANGKTIGNALSGASERYGDDCANLFAFLWNNFDDSQCPVSGGRGANGPDDFRNFKTIQLLDMRGFTAIGLAGMGNSVSNRLDLVPMIHGGVDTPGSWVGANAQVMSYPEMPFHYHGATTSVTVTLKDPGHQHFFEGPIAAGPGFAASSAGFLMGDKPTSLNGTNIYVESATATTYLESAGGNAAQNNVAYAVLGTWYIRL